MTPWKGLITARCTKRPDRFWFWFCANYLCNHYPLVRAATSTLTATGDATWRKRPITMLWPARSQSTDGSRHKGLKELWTVVEWCTYGKQYFTDWGQAPVLRCTDTVEYLQEWQSLHGSRAWLIYIHTSGLKMLWTVVDWCTHRKHDYRAETRLCHTMYCYSWTLTAAKTSWLMTDLQHLPDLWPWSFRQVTHISRCLNVKWQ